MSPTPTPAPRLTNALLQMREAVEAMMDENEHNKDEPPGR
jgi:hypothetical protein